MPVYQMSARSSIAQLGNGVHRTRSEGRGIVLINKERLMYGCSDRGFADILGKAT